MTVQEVRTYLRKVKARQPQGPYYLCGYSFGGLVAFEMAQRLRESGEDVALVGLFDTLMSPLKWPLRSWLAIARGRVARFAAGVVTAPTHTWAAAVWKMGCRACERQRGSLQSSPARILKVKAGALLASARHRPGFYPGELTLFTPVEREPGLPSIQAIWRKHAGALSIIEVGGDHWTMFSTPNAESAAASLTRCLVGHSQRTLPAVAASLQHS